MSTRKVPFDSKAYNEWVDAQLFPGETTSVALDRRIRFHRQNMARGISTGYNEETGKTTYTPPITLGDYPDCPWHGSHCSAWIALQDGYDTNTQPDLRTEMLQNRRERKAEANIRQIMADEGVSREEAVEMAARRKKRNTLKFTIPVSGNGGFRPSKPKPSRFASPTGSVSKAAKAAFSVDFDAEFDEEGDEQ